MTDLPEQVREDLRTLETEPNYDRWHAAFYRLTDAFTSQQAEIERLTDTYVTRTAEETLASLRADLARERKVSEWLADNLAVAEPISEWTPLDWLAAAREECK